MRAIHVKAIPFVLGLVLLTGACRKENPAAAERVVPPTLTQTSGTVDTATSPASPGGTALVPVTSAGTTVEVALEDNSIGMKTTGIPPGPAVFNVTNVGTATHSFRIEGEGMAVQLPQPLAPHATDSVSANLKPGKYHVSCPVLDHARKGETMDLTIPAS